MVATHEAAHAVVASALGWKVKRVALSDSGEGETLIDDLIETSVVWMVRHVFLSLAGVMATLCFLGEHGEGNAEDFDTARGIVRYWAGRAQMEGFWSDEAWLSCRMPSKVGAFVTRHRATIEAVAGALLERRCLTGEDVEAIRAAAMAARTGRGGG